MLQSQKFDLFWTLLFYAVILISVTTVVTIATAFIQRLSRRGMCNSRYHVTFSGTHVCCRGIPDAIRLVKRVAVRGFV